MSLGDIKCKRLLNYEGKVAKSKLLIFLFKNVLISHMNLFPNRISYYDFKVDF